MSGEETEDAVSVDLSAELAEWLDEQADRRDTDRAEVLRDLLSAHRSVAVDNGDLADERQPLGAGEDVDRRLADQREEFIELLEDVRKRVVQVKRETDAKATADHDHPELDGTLEDVDARLEGLHDEVTDLAATVEGLEANLDSGFENYRDVLTYLTDSIEEIEGRLDVIARAVVEVRSVSREVAATDSARLEAERLQQEANRNGFSKADCEECAATVDLSLLSTPECPHCSAAFVDVDPKRGILGSNRLLTGETPALEGRIDEDDRLAEMVSEGDEDDEGADLELSSPESEST